MSDREGSRPRVLLFIVFAYGLAVALALLIGLTGGYQSPLGGLRFAGMFLPALAAFSVGAVTGDRWRIDWNRLPVRYLPLALFVIPITMHAVMLPRLAAAGPLPWQDWLTPASDGLFHSPPDRGWGSLTMYGLVVRIAINAGVGLVIVSFLALFEEIGWRGWLLPRLIDRWGARWAILATSAIWAVWHVPFGLSGIQHIDGVSPLQLAFGIPLGVMASGIVIGWLWVRTESIWIVAIAHGSLNSWGQLMFKYLRDFETPAPGAILSTGFWALYLLGAVLLVFAMPPGRRGADPHGRLAT